MKCDEENGQYDPQSTTIIRTNGRGNAWPVEIGSDHPFYNKSDFSDLSNTSFSIINKTNETINWEILIDGGHGAIQYLIMNGNRIPDAIFLTHPHFDHICSIESIIEGFYRKHNRQKRYPLYASQKCYELVLQCLPSLQEKVEFNELAFGVKQSIPQAKGLEATAFPVYHGEGVPGASMFLFEINGKKVVFTGDILCPLLKQDDYGKILNPDVVFLDANNRFPYPETNHWCVTSLSPETNKTSEHLLKWKNSILLSDMIKPHGRCDGYFDSGIEELLNDGKIPCSVFEFTEMIQAKNAGLVHYSGRGDVEVYKDRMLADDELSAWVDQQSKKMDTNFFVPKVGDVFEL